MVDTGLNIFFQADRKQVKKIILLLSLSALSLVCLTVYATTTITTTGCESLLIVKLAFWGPGVNQSVMEGWERDAENLWNGPRASQLYGECKCKLKFDFQMQIVANAAACPADAHCIEVKRVGPAGSHRPYVVPGGDIDRDFFDGPYDGRRTGQFSERTNGLTAAHEIGHLMGLPDEYFEFDANYTVHANGSITLHGAWITYPRREVADEVYGEKIRDILQRRVASGRIRRGISNFTHHDGLTPGASNNSIMGQEPGFAWVAEKYLIDKITGRRRVICPDRCCCGNGVFDAGKEECEKSATPTGCSETKPKCSEECKCEPLPTTSTMATTITMGGGIATGGGEGEVTGTGGASPSTTIKPKCMASSDCGKATVKRICKGSDVYEQKSTPTCNSPGTPQAECVAKLKDTLAEDCGEDYCVNGECVRTTTTTLPQPGGCCDCPAPLGCASGPLIDAGDCPVACNPYQGVFIDNAICSLVTGNCEPVQAAATTTTLRDYVPTTTLRTCEQRGYYGSQSSCQGACHSPSYCTYGEATRCWHCNQVTVECGQGLHISSNCDGQCDSGKGEQCILYQGGPCYYCYCGRPDLIVAYRYANIQMSASTQCQGEACTTQCSLSASVDIRIRNVGPSPAGSSTASVVINPGVGTTTQSISPLNSGGTSPTHSLSFSKSGTVSGSGPTACAQLSWWASSYTVTATADSASAVSECIESNNQNSGTVAPSS